MTSPNCHHDLHTKPGAANRCLALLSKMFSLAERWGLRPDGSNPVRHVDRYPERKMERFLSSAEMAAIGAVLKRAETERIVNKNGVTGEGGENPYLIAAVRLLALTRRASFGSFDRQVGLFRPRARGVAAAN